MALPVKVKTWQYDVNQTISGTNVNQLGCDILFSFVQSLLGFGSNPWTHWGSCDGSTANNNSTTNLWVDSGDIVTGVNKSYIVLENPVTGMQICIWMGQGSVTWYATFIVSLNGEFGAPGSGGTGADGTLTTRPTAGDEVVLLNNSGFTSSVDLATYRMHVQHSTDGECTRVLLHRNNIAHWVGIFDAVSDPITGFTLPVAGWQVNTGSTQPTYAIWNDNPAMWGQIGGTNFQMYLTCEGAVSSMVGEQVNFADDDTNEWPIMPMGLLSVTGSHRGRKGSLYDLWWGSTAAGNGNTYPDDASKAFAQFDHMIFPWNGTTPGTA